MIFYLLAIFTFFYIIPYEKWVTPTWIAWIWSLSLSLSSLIHTGLFHINFVRLFVYGFHWASMLISYRPTRATHSQLTENSTEMLPGEISAMMEVPS